MKLEARTEKYLLGSIKRFFAAVLALACVLALAGCARTPTAEDLKAQCFSTEALVQTEMRLFKADSGMNAPLQTVLDKMHAACPSGGTYSYDPATEVVSCSVHGHP